MRNQTKASKQFEQIKKLPQQNALYARSQTNPKNKNLAAQRPNAHNGSFLNVGQEGASKRAKSRQNGARHQANGSFRA